MDKMIKFIGSEYNELFRVPDGGMVNITAADGYTHQAVCKYIDDYHLYLDNACLHICQLAEMMKRNGSRVEPIIENTYEFVAVTADELKFTMQNRDNEERGCVGRQRGIFNRDSRLFWDEFQTETEALKTNNFYSEFTGALNFLRLNDNNPLLRDMYSMVNECGEYDVLKIPNDYYDISLFKLEGGSHTHYVKCYIPKENNNNSEYFFTISSYNSHELQRYNDLQYVEQHYDCTDADKFYKTESGFTEIYYNPNANAGGQLVQIDFDESIVKEAAERYKKPEDFFEHIENMGRGYLIDVGTENFRAAFDNFMNNKADFEGATRKSMHGLMKAVGIKPPSKDVER